MEIKAIQLALNGKDFSSDEQHCPIGGVYQEGRGHSISRNVQISPGGHCLVKAASGQHESEIHSGGEEHFIRPVKLCDQILLVEWSLHPQVFNNTCREFGHPHVSLFATTVNTKLPVYVLHIPDPMAFKEDTFQHQWSELSVYAFPPFALLRQVLSMLSHNLP